MLNLVGVHAAVLVAAGRFAPKVYAAYSVFYVLGTALAIQVPVVGWAPLKSLEQLGPCTVFLAYQLIQLTKTLIQQQRQEQKGRYYSYSQAWMLRVQVFGMAAAVGRD